MNFNAEDTSYYTQNQQNKSRRQVEDQHRDLGLENQQSVNVNSRTRTRNRTSSSSTRDNSHTKMSNWNKKEIGNNESSSNSISYSNTYQTQHQNQNQNQRSSNAKGYNSSSAGSLGSTLTHSQANAATENLIDADFSDHFVVPRKPLPENENGDLKQSRIQQQYQHQHQHQLSSENSKFQDSDPFDDKIGKGVASLSANVKKLLTPFQFGKRPKTSGVSPVLDGKRSHNAQALGAYIPSSSSEFSHPLYMLSSAHANAAAAATATIIIPGRAHAFHDIDERLINNTGAVTRARAGSSKVTTERQVLSGRTENGNTNSPRNSASVLRPFTAGEVSIPSTMSPSASAASASTNFQEYEFENYGSNNHCSSSKGVSLNSADCSNHDNSNPFGLDPQFYNNNSTYNRSSSNNGEGQDTFFSKPIPLSQSGAGETKGQRQGQTTEFQGQSQVRRLPYGYYSKQYQMVVNKNSTENSLQSHSYLSQSQSQNPYPSYNSASTSKNQYSLRSQNQNQNQGQKVASRQNSNTIQQQQSQIPKPRKQTGIVPVPVSVPFQAVRPQENLLSKPNVYRNLSYSSNYTSMMTGTGTGTETIPDVREPKIGEFNSPNSTLPSPGTGTGYEPSFFSTSKSESKSNSKKCETETHGGACTPMVTTRAAAAAKGDAPVNSTYFNLPGSNNRTGSGSESVVVEIPESLVPSNMATTSSLSYMRPKTVCENQVSYTQKLSMDSMIKQPSGRLGGCALGMGPYFQQHQILSQNQRAGIGKTGQISGSTSAVLPHHENVMSSSVINTTATALVTGTRTGTVPAGSGGGSHSESQKLVSSQNFRNDLTSPLGPFHIPIRPFIIPQPAPATSVPLHGEEYEFELNNRAIAGMGISTLLRDFNNNGSNMNYDYDCNNANNTSTNLNNLRHSIFQTCSQRNPIPVHLIFDYLVNTRKVGEGVYGEVFKAYFRGLPDQRVYKIVPIEGSKIVNGEKQKKFGEVEPEIIISQELNKLRCGQNGCYTDGHCRMLHTRICQGKYPAALIEQWKTWHRTYVSQNDLPEFESKQLYTIFEFEYHGTDIESFKFQNAKQSMAVLLHVIHALAAAEAGLEFEHRDLHWGNILVVKTRDPFTSYTVQGMNFRVPNCGLKSTIIDYTISRLTSTTGQVIFTDLADDEDQFCGSEDYQFEIYRMMREENKNDWSKFCPKTNIFWAHYLVGKLIDKGRYNDITSATHSLFKNKLLRIQSNLLKFQSCAECIRRYLPPFCRDLETADI